jgi:hypothetical protein
MRKTSTPEQRCRPTKRAADRPVAAIFHFRTVPNGISVHTLVLTGRRLTQAVGLAATRLLPVPLGSRTGVSVIGPRPLLPAVSARAPACASSAHVRACQPFICRANARARIASPLPSQRAPPVLARRITAIAIPVRFRVLRTAALSYARCPVLARADCRYADPAAPPNTCCSRPPCRGDFPPRRVPAARGGSHCCTRRAAAERHRWAAKSSPPHHQRCSLSTSPHRDTLVLAFSG